MLKMNNGLTESYFISSFTNGLNEELQPVVKMLRPFTLNQDFDQARLQEQSIKALFKKQGTNNQSCSFSKSMKFYSFIEHFHPPDSNNKRGKITRAANAVSKGPNTLDTRRYNNPCYHYGEQFFFGHQCNNKPLLMMEGDDLEECEEYSGIDEVKETMNVEISMYAIDRSASLAQNNW
ncbi:conserved hypothetical protein [Ricinus communis]|uniref:Uncharacterized protein n=1 Tax=Ricinus communis TaxID=3988 RepID=B9S6I6_RICCO|nr:conserved hypothetical protein [Ricinus communis]